jgi:acyl-CoA thioesterase
LFRISDLEIRIYKTGGFDVSAEKIKDLICKNDELGKLLGVKLTEVSEGRAYAELTVGKQHLNAAGVCHGGSIFALADIALAAASNSYGQVALLTNGNISVFHASQEGDTLTAKAKEISASRKLGHYRVKITNSAGEQIAIYNATVYKTSKPLPDS